MNADIEHVLNLLINMHESRFSIARLTYAGRFRFALGRLCKKIGHAAITDEKLLDATALCFANEQTELPAEIAGRVLKDPQKYAPEVMLKARAIKARADKKLTDHDFKSLIADARRGTPVLQIFVLAALYRHSVTSGRESIAEQAWKLAKPEQLLRGWYYALIGTPKEEILERLRVPNVAPML